MCTLIALHRAVIGAPLVVAANRDEYFDREAQAPRVEPAPGGAILAPKDLRAGGTWLGINASGVFAAVTNRRGGRNETDRRSRGFLVTEALGHKSAREGALAISEAPESSYNAFNFFIADGRSAFIVTYDERPTLREVEPGVHVVGNVEPDDRTDPKVARLFEQAEKAALSGRHRVLDELATICREHDCGEGTLGDTCVHTARYGTRSSCLLRQSQDRSEDRFLYADGAPCGVAYEDFTSLLPELTATASYAAGEKSARSAI